MNPFDPSAYSRFTLMVRSENIPPKIITTWSEAFVNAHFPPSLYPAVLLLVVPERRVSVWAVVVRAGPFCCVFLFSAGLVFFCIGTESYKHNHMHLRTDTHTRPTDELQQRKWQESLQAACSSMVQDDEEDKILIKFCAPWEARRERERVRKKRSDSWH